MVAAACRMDPEAEMREREGKKLVLQVDKLTLVQRST